MRVDCKIMFGIFQIYISEYGLVASKICWLKKKSLSKIVLLVMKLGNFQLANAMQCLNMKKLWNKQAKIFYKFSKIYK